MNQFTFDRSAVAEKPASFSAAASLGRPSLASKPSSFLSPIAMTTGLPGAAFTEVNDRPSIRAGVDVIEELALGWWTGSLRPIADRFVAAAEGHVDVEHFRGIY